MSDFTYPDRIELARLPTPIQPLPRLSEELGVELSVKRDDLTGMELGGNKVRKLEFLLAEALGRAARVVLSCGGVQSNHCRATALAARQVGLDSFLFLRGDRPDRPSGNYLLDLLAGARIRFVTLEQYRGVLPLMEAQARALDVEAYVIPEGGSNGLGAMGYARACTEIPADRYDWIVHAIGSGGTSAGLLLGQRLHGLTARIAGVNVCDDAACFRERIAAILADARCRTGALASVEDLTIVDGHVGPGYARATPDQHRTLVRAARAEGLLLDPVYTGKAFAGLIAEVERGSIPADSRVLFLHTGGLFGLMDENQVADLVEFL